MDPVINRLDLKTLWYYICVVEAGSLSRAAIRLHIAQPALGNRILQLEQSLNVQLLNRGPYGVVSTKEGQAFYEAAKRIVRDVQTAANDVRSMDKLVAGQVKLGSLVSSARMFSADLVLKVIRDHPDIRLSFLSASSAEIHRRLVAGELDLGLMFRNAEADNLLGTPLIREEMLFARAATGNPIEESIPFDEVMKMPLVLTVHTAFSMRHVVEKAFNLRGVAPTVVAELDCPSTMETLVKSGVASTIVPWSAIHLAVERGEISVS